MNLRPPAEAQFKLEHPEDNGAADLSAVCEANALTMSPQVLETLKYQHFKVFLTPF